MSRRPRLDDLPPQSVAAGMYGQKGIIDFQEANMLANPMLANPFLLASLQANSANNAMTNPAANNPFLSNLNPMPNPMLAAATGAAAFAPPDVMAQNILAAQALAHIQGRTDKTNSLALLQQQQHLANMQQQTAMQQLAMQQAALSLPFGADAHTAALLAAQSVTGSCCNETKKNSKNRGDFNSNPSKQPLTPQMSIAVAQAKAVADILRCNNTACDGGVKQTARKQNSTTASNAAVSSKAKTVNSRAGPGGANMGKTTSNAKHQADHKLRENIRRCVESRH